MITQLGGKVVKINGTDVDFVVFDSKTISFAKLPFENEGKTIPVHKQFIIGTFFSSLIYRCLHLHD